MSELKVKSKKYNDADILEINEADFKSAVDKALANTITKVYDLEQRTPIDEEMYDMLLEQKAVVRYDGIVWFPVNASNSSDSFYLVAFSMNETAERLEYMVLEVDDLSFVGGDLDNADTFIIPKSADINKLEKIEDAQGHKRFVEGTFTPVSKTGVTYTYSKWSLSGTHLMIVLAGSIEANTLFDSESLALVEMPQWVIAKCIPSGNTEKIVSVKKAEMWADNVAEIADNAKLYCGLQKVDSSNLRIATWNSPSITYTDACFFRISFDLLIDNESEE